MIVFSAKISNIIQHRITACLGLKFEFVAMRYGASVTL